MQPRRSFRSRVMRVANPGNCLQISASASKSGLKTSLGGVGMAGSAPFAELPKRRAVTVAGRDKGRSSDSDCVANLFTEMHLTISEVLRAPQPNIPRLVQQSRKEIVDIQNLVFSYTGPESTNVFVPLGREVQGSRAALT